MNVWCIQGVDMAIVMKVHGNVYATRIGVAFYVIKVSYELFSIFFRMFITKSET